MNNHRKLLVLGLNEVLRTGNVSLDPAQQIVDGHMQTEIAGRPSVVIWHGISGDEVHIAVWWDYDHSKHPQANLEGNQRERFHGPSPLAKPQHYPKFVGAFSSGWVERRTGAYIQGFGDKGLDEVYTRRGEAEELLAIPKPIPMGFEAEGKFFR